MTTFDFSRQVVLNVTTTQDQNDGSKANGLSLRDAILQANANPSTEYIINLRAGTYNLSVKNVLQPPSVDDSSIDPDTLIESRKTTGDLEITGRIKIVGINPEETIINAFGIRTDFDARSTDLPLPSLSGGEFDPIPTPNTSVFTVGDRVFDVGAGGILTLDNVTVKNGLLISPKSVIVNIVDGELYTVLDADGNPIRVIPLVGVITEKDVDAGGTIKIGNIDTTPEGAAIRIEENGTVILNNSIISSNSSESIAGGIYNKGILEVNGSVIQENFSGEGSGIHNVNKVTITNSSIINNSAGSPFLRFSRVLFPVGAGIFNEPSGELTVINSTISGNSGGVDGGGGILSKGNATILNSTITQNEGQVGPGIWAETNTANVLLINSIVAQNYKPIFETDGTPIGISYNVPDIDGFFNPASSFNLIGNANGILLNGINGNISGSSNSLNNGDNSINAKLGPLQDNGGLTPTHALLKGSPAINAGNSNVIELRQFFSNNPVDQIGNPRINGSGVDIGSVEFGSGNSNNANPNTALDEDDSLLKSPLYRFQNTSVSGTYLYAGREEAESIRSNFSNFADEGIAFNVSEVAGDDLIAMYRFQNTAKPGTYLLAGEEERQSILRNNRNFVDEGIAFYVYGADANKGDDIYRFQSLSNSGTYLFVGEAEKNNIVANFSSSFRLEGVAFEVG